MFEKKRNSETSRSDTGISHEQWPISRLCTALMNRNTFDSLISRAAVLSFILCLLVIVPAEARTWYVDLSPQGGQMTGALGNAWNSLAFNGLAAGDTVYISGGPRVRLKAYTLPGRVRSSARFRDRDELGIHR